MKRAAPAPGKGGSLLAQRGPQMHAAAAHVRRRCATGATGNYFVRLDSLADFVVDFLAALVADFLAAFLAVLAVFGAAFFAVFFTALLVAGIVALL